MMITTGLALYSVSASVTSPFRGFQFLLPLWGGAQTARWFHHVGMWLILAFAVHHVYSAVLMSQVEARGTVESMASGLQVRALRRPACTPGYRYLGPEGCRLAEAHPAADPGPRQPPVRGRRPGTAGGRPPDPPLRRSRKASPSWTEAPSACPSSPISKTPNGPSSSMPSGGRVRPAPSSASKGRRWPRRWRRGSPPTRSGSRIFWTVPAGGTVTRRCLVLLGLVPQGLDLRVGLSPALAARPARARRADRRPRPEPWASPSPPGPMAMRPSPLAALVLSLTSSACKGPEGSSAAGLSGLAVPEARLRSSEARDRGRALYLRHCALCHGIRADGQGARREGLSTRPRDFTSAAWRRGATPRLVFFAVREGVPARPCRAGSRWTRPRPGTSWPSCSRLGDPPTTKQGRACRVRRQIFRRLLPGNS